MGYLDDVIKESKEEKKRKEKEEIDEEEIEKSEEMKKESTKIPSSEIEKIKKEREEFDKEPQKDSEEELEDEETGEVKIEGKKELITSYEDVKIYKVEDEPLPVYEIPVIKPRGPEKRIINTLKEAATQLITVSPEKFRSEEKRRKFYLKRIKEIIESNPELGVPETKKDFYSEMVVREMIGYGIIDPLVKDKNLEEIMVISPNKPVYVHHREYDTMKTNVKFGVDEEIRDVIDRIGRQVGRRIDRSNPLLDARLPDGSRVNATIKPISLEGSTLTIRSFRENPISLTDLIKWNTITPESGAYLWFITEGLEVRPANILVSGGTASGKTTTLNVLSSLIPARERIISVEQTAELNLPVEHWVKLETRPPGLEGKGEISMDALVKNSLRMRPDRMIVGEIRGEEAFSLFTAMNTGHDGSMGTVHANSAKETITRITSPPMDVPIVMANALDFIIIQKRLHHPQKGLIRRVTDITEVQKVKEDGSPELNTLFSYDPTVDKLKRKNRESLYEREITRYLDVSKGDIKKEIEKRKKYLERLVKEEIKDQNELKKRLKEYNPLYKLE